MTTTTATTNELPPLEISPLYSDCTIQVPLDDRSGFHTYNLHLCILYKSPYFEKMVPNPKKVHSIPTLKSHFDIILRYIYNKKQIYYDDNNILDLITEGYRFSLPNFVEQLWSVFARNASAKMVIDALKRIEDRCEFYKKWDQSCLQKAIKRNILTLFDMIGELKTFKSIQLIIDSAEDQNPVVILSKLRQWSKREQRQRKGAIYRTVRSMEVAYMKRCQAKNIKAVMSKDGHLTRAFSALDFSKDVRFTELETSTMILVDCDVGSTQKVNNKSIEILSVSPLEVLLTPKYYDVTNFMVRLWDKEGSFYISKRCKHKKSLVFDILNAHEWTDKYNDLRFEVIQLDSDSVTKNEAIHETTSEKPPAFDYSANLAKLSADFSVECRGEKGPVVYQLHKFILQQSPHFQRMFSMSSFIEAKTNKATIETPSHLFEIILRYLYDQEPLKGIASIITDVILEASYFDLSDFENELWSLFEREADVTNCIKAINLIESNMHFKMHQSKVMKIVAKKIKAILKDIEHVSEWNLVRTILNLKCTKKQNPLLILESVKNWCKVHEPKNCEKRVREIFSKIKSNVLPQAIAKELCAKYPYLTGVQVMKTENNITHTVFVREGTSVTLDLSWEEINVSGDVLTPVTQRKQVYLLHDQLSSHCIVVHEGTNLRTAVENIEEWKYGVYYRISVARKEVCED